MSSTRDAKSAEITPPPIDGAGQNEAGSGSDHSPLANRARLLIFGFALIILVVVGRLAYWQLIAGRSDAGPPDAPPVVAAPEASRGRIVDSKGLLLATDDFAYEIYARPQKIYTSAISQTVVISLTQVLGQTQEEITNELATEEQLLVLAKTAVADQCKAVDKVIHQPDLVWCIISRKRVYPQGDVAAHLLGFTNYERRGIYGVEASYNNWLQSDGDWPSRNFPSQPQTLADAWKLYLPSPSGRDLILYLDAPLQYMVETRLRDAVAHYGAERGTIIIMDPRSGGILALANYPGFDPNQFSDVEQDTWVNSAVGEIFEPGSVFKIVTYAAALDSGRITPDTLFQDSGSLEVAGRTIRNAEGRAYGRVTAREALLHSINVISARISMDLGPEIFYGDVRKFGFGKLTEVDLNLESGGIVKERGNPDWSVFDQAANSFGQGISVTALQMINAVAAVANKGVLLQPHIVRGMVKNGQVYYLPTHVIGRPIRADTARKLTDMMVYTVDKSSYAGLVPGFRLAGKTGTAEIPTAKGYVTDETITSFIGFLPADDPQLVIMVKLDKAKTSRWAEQVVVPVFGQVAQDTVRILDVKPR
jgi:cell division protein FtsI/penicillin-binding protein 2